MSALAKQIIWVTGAGSGIGEAAALTLAAAGATVVLTGRRQGALESVASRIVAAGGQAAVDAGDLTDASRVQEIAESIRRRFGRLDVLVNNAGVNIRDRSTAALEPAGIDTLLSTNLAAPFYCATSVLPIFREQGGGLMIHTASWLGRYYHKLGGAGYVAAKHAVVAMSHAINMEEFRNNIRSTVLCPGEVATPVLANRPVPVPKEERDRMLQAQDVADMILMIASLPGRVCLNELVISPTWNRMFLPERQAGL